MGVPVVGDRMRACTYCGCDIDAHDPVCLRDCDPAGELLGQYCNYGCLSTHIDEADLAAGSACVCSPEDAPPE
jgi:hypothetical protein